MSRSNYSDDIDTWAMIRWRGAVKAAVKGNRGQALLKEMLAEFDVLSDKRLIPYDLEKEGEVCALGAVGRARGIDLAKIDPKDSKQVAKTFNISEALAAEIAFMNDEVVYSFLEMPEERFARMRRWIEGLIVN